MNSLEPFDSIFRISSFGEFERMALTVFNYQVKENAVYRDYVASLKVDPAGVKELTRIPFLPVEFFKTHKIVSGNTSEHTKIFTSSGAVQSKHFVNAPDVYEQSFRKGFELFYGPVTDYCFLALLPSYLEREGSSLIYMAEDFIKRSNHPSSGFYLDDYDSLILQLQQLEAQQQKVILLGVTYALLELIEKQHLKLQYTIVMETGGMKGKRKEMVREELHTLLCAGLGVNSIHSEYGMTELLSQAYSKGKGIFSCPPWMTVLIRDTNDPFSFVQDGRTGGVNIVDLANIHSCSFIATQDLGKKHSDKRFEVLGRFDNSDLRGCNLMVD